MTRCSWELRGNWTKLDEINTNVKNMQNIIQTVASDQRPWSCEKATQHAAFFKYTPERNIHNIHHVTTKQVVKFVEFNVLQGQHIVHFVSQCKWHTLKVNID